MSYIDRLLNKITMYRLALYYLIALLILALILSAFDLLSFSPLALIYSTIILVFVSWVANSIFGRTFRTHTNAESVYITALILALIISPPSGGEFLSMLPFLIWAGILAMASKFILAYGRKHFFNPAAIAVAITALSISQSATWWVGNAYMFPLVFIGGLLVIRKIQRFDLFISFAAASLAAIILTAQNVTAISSFEKIILDTPFMFFGSIMLTEPLTAPPRRNLRIIYGVLTGILFAPAIHIGSIYSTPELALIIGNIFSYLVSPKRKFMLNLKEKTDIARMTKEYVFVADKAVPFIPGQYLEWTLSHKHSDSRGNRRYFTIASSPTEPDIRIGVKFSESSSSFKKELMSMQPERSIMAGQLAGDFVLPKDPKQKLAFLAGGIGITPFRSMIKYLSDKNEYRDMILIYAANSMEDVAYSDIIREAEKKTGLKTYLALTGNEEIPAGWKGKKGYIDADFISGFIPDFHERKFYVSGPRSMVNASQSALRKLGVPWTRIKTDFFPGFA